MTDCGQPSGFSVQLLFAGRILCLQTLRVQAHKVYIERFCQALSEQVGEELEEELSRDAQAAKQYDHLFHLLLSGGQLEGLWMVGLAVECTVKGV